MGQGWDKPFRIRCGLCNRVLETNDFEEACREAGFWYLIAGKNRRVVERVVAPALPAELVCDRCEMAIVSAADEAEQEAARNRLDKGAGNP